MTQTVNTPGQPGGGQSKTEQVRETTQAVHEKAQEASGQVSGRVREQVDQRSTQAGEQVGSMADALRRTGEQLRGEGQDQPARLTEQAAERVDRLGAYLRESDSDQILGDLEGFARRRPWSVAAGGAVVGFLASRLVKASSTGGSTGGRPSAQGTPLAQETAPPPPTPQETVSPPLDAGVAGAPTRPGIPDAAVPPPLETPRPGSTAGM